MNVFIVENSSFVRDQLQSMLSAIPGVDVVGYAEDELNSIEQINKLLPDVVTLDLHLQAGSGVEVLKDVKKHHPAIKVIVLTNYTDKPYLDGCKQAGADCFFDKTFQFSRVRSALWSWVYASQPGNEAVALRESGK